MPVSVLQGGKLGPSREKLAALTPASHQFTHLRPQNGQTHTSVKTHTGTSSFEAFPSQHCEHCVFFGWQRQKTTTFLKPGSWHESSLGSLHATGSSHPENSCTSAIRSPPLNTECVCFCVCECVLKVPGEPSCARIEASFAPKGNFIEYLSASVGQTPRKCQRPASTLQ